MVCARCWHGSHRGCDDARNAGDGDPPQSTRSSSFCQRKFRIQKRCHQFWRVEAVVDKNISDVPSAKKDDRMAIFANLFIRLGARSPRWSPEPRTAGGENSGDQTQKLLELQQYSAKFRRTPVDNISLRAKIPRRPDRPKGRGDSDRLRRDLHRRCLVRDHRSVQRCENRAIVLKALPFCRFPNSDGRLLTASQGTQGPPIL